MTERAILSREALKQAFIEIVTKSEDWTRPIMLTWTFYAPKRTRAQEKTYHMWFREVDKKMTESIGLMVGEREWKLYFKSRYLPYIEGVNGKQYQMGTSDMNVKQGVEFMEKIQYECAEGVPVLMPNGEYAYIVVELTQPPDYRYAMHGERND